MTRDVMCDWAPGGKTVILVAFENDPCVFCGERAGDHEEIR